MSLRKTPSTTNSSTPLRYTMDQMKPYHKESNKNKNNSEDRADNNSSFQMNDNTSIADYIGDNNSIDNDRGKKQRAPPISGSGTLKYLQSILGLYQPQISYQAPPTQPQPTPSSPLPTSPIRPTSSLPPPFVIQVTAIASLGGVLFGYDMGVIAGALPQLTTTFDLNDKQQELVVSILYLGGGLGAAVGGSLCDLLGRKPAILWTDIGFMVGAAVLFTATHVSLVCLGRIIVGFAVAVSGIADVSYLHEIAPKQWRGAIVSVNEACISLGFLFAFVVGTVLSESSSNNNEETSSHPPQGWRYMFALGGVMAAVQFFGMWGMPESPVWLKDQGRHSESLLSLQRIHGRYCERENDDDNTDDPEHALDANQNTNQQHQQRPATPPRPTEDNPNNDDVNSSYESLSPIRPNGDSTNVTEIPGTSDLRGPALWVHQWRLVLYRVQAGASHLRHILQRYRRQVWIALFLSVTQQFCGQTNVLNYAPTILRAVVKQDNAANGNYDEDGDDEELSGWATLSIGLVKFIVTVLVIWKIEYIGRRSLLLIGMGIIAFGLLLVAVAFSGGANYLKGQQANTTQDVVVQSGSGFYFALPGILCVVSGYSMSFGPLTWLLTSELFPTEIRGRALGASTIITYLCASVVTYSFLTAQSLMGTSTVFFLYMIITIVGFAFACVAIPDTGGKTMEEIDVQLRKMPWWKHRREHKALTIRKSQSSTCGGCTGDADSLSNPSTFLQTSSRNSSSSRFGEAELM